MRFGRRQAWYEQVQPDDEDWASHNLPVADEQRCGFCGSSDWRWVYPMTMRPSGSIACGSIWVTCERCHRAVEANDDAALVARHVPDTDDEPYSFADELLPTFHASRIGDALTREAAQARG